MSASKIETVFQTTETDAKEIKKESDIVSPVIEKVDVINTPNLLSSAAIRAALVKDEANRKKDKAILNVDNLQTVWNEYLDTHNSKGVKSALKNVKLSFEVKTIHIKVPTLFIKELILQEAPLMDLLRNSFLEEGIIILVEVSKNEFPGYEDASNFVAKLTSKEIYEKMNQKNPLLQELVQKIGLKPVD